MLFAQQPAILVILCYLLKYKANFENKVFENVDHKIACFRSVFYHNILFVMI